MKLCFYAKLSFKACAVYRNIICMTWWIESYSLPGAQNNSHQQRSVKQTEGRCQVDSNHTHLPQLRAESAHFDLPLRSLLGKCSFPRRCPWHSWSPANLCEDQCWIAAFLADAYRPSSNRQGEIRAVSTSSSPSVLGAHCRAHVCVWWWPRSSPADCRLNLSQPPWHVGLPLYAAVCPGCPNSWRGIGTVLHLLVVSLWHVLPSRLY